MIFFPEILISDRITSDFLFVL